MIFLVLKVLLKPLAIPCRFFQPLDTMHNVLYLGCLWYNCNLMYVVRQPATVLYSKVSVDNSILVLQFACLALPRDICYIIATNRFC
jgi:hypothetical protein